MMPGGGSSQAIAQAKGSNARKSMNGYEGRLYYRVRKAIDHGLSVEARAAIPIGDEDHGMEQKRADGTLGDPVCLLRCRECRANVSEEERTPWETGSRTCLYESEPCVTAGQVARRLATAQRDRLSYVEEKGYNVHA